MDTIDEWIRVFRKTKPAPGTSGPLIPGDPREKPKRSGAKKEIPLLKPIVEGYWVYRGIGNVV
jgi:L-2-hydroxycarboxylate dehydrogenase (NAD+)